MGRKVVCKICKEKGDSDLFFFTTDEKGRRKYYCSESEYNDFLNQKEKRYKLLDYIAVEILKYEEGQIVPPVMTKKIQALNEFYDYEVLKECFKQNKESIHYWIKVKNFQSEYGMASYIMKIIEGSVNDVYNSWKHKKRVIERQETDKVNVDIMNQLENNTVKKNENDEGILAFLDEEDI
ncbi:hypothetical protein QU593_10355 [Rossellomorea marisflavi]|uniref:hypothetical protein n=1 Tax=Rossellomorea marisflavi TaxID=189381 RepID=UPI0025B05F59|nr:hypothetical protein [Rossellomorea marisflavi]WJV20807.1 hypothetical protein QU593_10355 [Rossellomorea marisflavi]